MKKRAPLYLAFAIAIFAGIAMIIPGNNLSLTKAKKANMLISEKQPVASPASESATETAKPKSTPKSTDILYYAVNLKEGAIGILKPKSGEATDNPADNAFFINTDKTFTLNDKVWLEYELYGLADYNSVSRSINDERTLGGWYIKKTEGWNTQSEQVNPLHIKQGKNCVRFSIPDHAKYAYKVRNIRLRVEPAKAGNDRRLVVNQPTDQYYYQKYGYLRGFVCGKGAENAKLTVNEKAVQANLGVFECLTAKPADSSGKFTATVTATFDDGMKLTTNITFNKACEPDFFYAYDTTIRHQEFMAQAGQPVHLKLGGAELSGDSGSVKENTNLTLTALRSIDMPVMGSGMVNVTAGAKGYRFLPHGSLFAKDLALKINYDTTLLPAGYRASDIRTYYFDDNQQSWVMLPLDTIHAGKGMIASLTNHFTDFVNAILKTPESPQTQAYTPTSIKDIKAANPFEGLNLIQAPKANNMGTANLSFPIEVPAGRQGLQPNLAIQYNSGGGNGWLGVGWDLSIPAFTVETRWGVPRYDAVKETESYLMAGEQLTPTAHRDSTGNRSTTQTTKQFYPRVEGAFNRIIRHGTTPQTYWWEVTDRNGIKYYYGKYSSDAAVNQTLVLTDGAGNIAHWALAETRDLDGNYVKYIYDTIYNVGIPGGTVEGKQIYISQIVYTGHGTTNGKYKVDFVRKLNDHSEIRNDAIISGRYGFKEVTANLLHQIKVSYNDTNIRSYLILYKSGAYAKNLICTIVEGQDTNSSYISTLFLSLGKTLDQIRESGIDPQLIDTSYYCDKDFDIKYLRKGIKAHKFDYFEETGGGFDNQATTINTSDDQVRATSLLGIGNNATSLSLSGGRGWSAGGGLSVGFDWKTGKKSNSVGGSYNYASSNSETMLFFSDINGDGYPDKVYKKNGSTYYRRLTKNGSSYSLGSEVPISSICFLGTESTTTNGWGIEGHMGFSESFSINASYGKSTATTTISRYFSDVNGDGLPDLVDDGKVYFNRLNANGDPTFHLASEPKIIIGDDTCSYIHFTGVINDSILITNTDERVLDQFDDIKMNHESVRMWIAPYDGSIRIHAKINLLKNTSYNSQHSNQGDGIRYTMQHNNYELWTDSIMSNDTTTHNDSIFTVNLQKGDRIYFRLQPRNYRNWDDVYWNPQIYYYGTDTATTDADRKKINKFNAETDFFVNSKLSEYSMPQSGRVRISGNLQLPALSDTLVFSIVKGNNKLYTRTFTDNNPVTYFVDTTINIEEDSILRFYAKTSSNINFNQIKNGLKYDYVQTDSLDIDTTSEFNRILQKVDLIYNVYQLPYFKSQVNVLNITNQDVIKPILTFSQGSQVNGTITFTVKKANKILAKRNLTITNSSIGTNQNVQLSSGVNDSIYFDFFTDSINMAPFITSAGAKIINTTYNAGLHATIPDSLYKFGNLYRGWGQFSYNEKAYEPINENILTLANYAPSGNTINIDTTNSNEPDSMFAHINNVANVNPATLPFECMRPDLDSMVWRSSMKITMVGANTMSDAYPLIYTSDSSVNYPIPDTVPGMVRTVVNKQIIQKNTSWGVSAGISHFNVNGNHSRGSSETFVDFIDINGDRFPDNVGPLYTQFTNSQGGLEENSTPLTVSGDQALINKSRYNSYGATLGGKYPYISSKSNKASEATSPRKFAVSCNSPMSGTLGYCTDNTPFTYLDVNGDGLPDRVQDNGNVALNLGYKFTPYEKWVNVVLKEGASKSVGGNIGAGQLAQLPSSVLKLIKKPCIYEYSWAFGVSFNNSYNDVKKYQTDVNGDGLVDIVYTDYGSSNKMKVYFNTGNMFLDDVNWFGIDADQKSTSFNGDGDVAATIGFAFPLFIVPIKFLFSGNASKSSSSTKDNIQVMDVNADGLPDFVMSDEENDLRVRFNKLGKTNLLKNVENTAGSTFELNYTLTENTQKMPQRNWVLSSVLAYDGHPGDGADYSYATFEYKNGVYSRSERQSFGFDTVITKQYDTQIDPANPKNGTCYRTITEKYHNDNFMFKGIKRYELLSDCSNHKYVETVYTYKAKRISTGEEVPENMMNCYCDYFPAISSEDKYFYEGQSSYTIHTRKEYVHGPYGNVTEYHNLGDVSDSKDNLFGYIQYSPILTNNQLGLVAQIEVKDYAQTLMRSRRAHYISGNGKMDSLIINNNGTYSNYEFRFDSYGNLYAVNMPENNNHQVYSLSYQYDDQVYTYPVMVDDILHYKSKTEYDFRFGKPVKTIDISGNEMWYSYDYDGRIRTITAPYEIEANIPYTLKFEYWDDYNRKSNCVDKIPWARTRHYDPANQGNEITTVLFADGFGRVLQTKKKTTIYNNGTTDDFLTVSGKVTYDAFGRCHFFLLSRDGGTGRRFGI